MALALGAQPHDETVERHQVTHRGSIPRGLDGPSLTVFAIEHFTNPRLFGFGCQTPTVFASGILIAANHLEFEEMTEGVARGNRCE